MKKLDFKKDLKHLYQPGSQDFTIVDVPPMNFLMIDGQGNPNIAPAYTQALEALYAVAYALKFICKREYSVDYTVPPPEGLWWTPDMATFALADKDAWHWTMMIMQPEPVTAALVARAVEETRRKKTLPALDSLRFETYHEGLPCRSCTSARMRLKRRRWPACTANTCRLTDWPRLASTTRST